jgi:hypothetical protein
MVTIMNSCSRFVLENETSKALSIQVEPEAVRFALEPGESATITDQFKQSPVTLRFSDESNGDSIVSVWPGDGEVVVKKCGKDVLDVA